MSNQTDGIHETTRGGHVLGRRGCGLRTTMPLCAVRLSWGWLDDSFRFSCVSVTHTRQFSTYRNNLRRDKANRCAIDRFFTARLLLNQEAWATSEGGWLWKELSLLRAGRHWQPLDCGDTGLQKSSTHLCVRAYFHGTVLRVSDSR